MHTHQNPRNFLTFLRILSTLCGCLALSACFNVVQSQHPVDHYILEYPSPQIEAGPPVGAAIRLARFRATPPYNTTRFLYRSSQFQRNADEYHRWRSQPGDMVTFFLARDLGQSGLFGGIFVDDTRADTAFRIEGIVEELYEDNMGPGQTAVLSVTATLLRTDTPDISQQLLLQKTYSTREPFDGRAPAAMVAAMSRAMARVSTGVIDDVYRKLTELGNGPQNPDASQ
ncbi:MAG: membrane integrity-associated transporter subunit PqiC [Desulfobacterales bacterium]|nr:membrane integrity-associated transporter subunit PqiC [Desulfobacterales bacterium]